MNESNPTLIYHAFFASNARFIYLFFLRKERRAISQQQLQGFNVQEKNKVQNLFRERLRKDHSPDLQKNRTGTVVESAASLSL